MTKMFRKTRSKLKLVFKKKKRKQNKRAVSATIAVANKD